MRLIDADKLIDVIQRYANEPIKLNDRRWDTKCVAIIQDMIGTVKVQPIIEAEPVVRCKDCKWWDKKDDSPYGYCHACKHGHMSEHWEISIYRTYKGDWYCADGERKDDDETD